MVVTTACTFSNIGRIENALISGRERAYLVETRRLSTENYTTRNKSYAIFPTRSFGNHRVRVCVCGGGVKRLNELITFVDGGGRVRSPSYAVFIKISQFLGYRVTRSKRFNSVADINEPRTAIVISKLTWNRPTFIVSGRLIATCVVETEKLSRIPPTDKMSRVHLITGFRPKLNVGPFSG